MNRTLQSLLLHLYQAIRSTGVLNTKLGRNFFDFLYNLYKLAFEAGPINHLKDFIEPNSCVIDVGANIGFFTTRFCKWVGNTGRVIAIEPEEANFQRLKRMVSKNNMGSKVDLLKGLVAEKDGELFLELNPDHPGDHKIGADGIKTVSYKLDSILEERNWPDVSFIKIDVQGAEERVLDGAEQTFERYKPNIFIEVHDIALQEFGSSSRSLLERVEGMGYTIHILRKNGISDKLSVNDALLLIGPKENYMDFLCLGR